MFAPIRVGTGAIHIAKESRSCALVVLSGKQP